MIFSFFGLSKPAPAVCDSLIKLIKNYRCQNGGAASPLEPGGVYVPNLSACANFASARSMAVYMNGQELIKKSDIIFVFVPDHTIRAFARNMRRYKITGKIFCHFNPAFDAEILDFDSGNTYVSFIAPVNTKNRNPDLLKGLIMQGYGHRFDELSEAMKILGLGVSHLSVDEKCLYQSAVNMLLKVSEHSKNIAAKLIKSVMGSESGHFDAIEHLFRPADYDLDFYDSIASGDEEYIDNQRRLIKTMGFDDVSILYASLLLLESTTAKTEMSSKLKEIAKNIIKKY